MTSNPRDVTINAFVEILEGTQSAIEIKELCNITCKRNMQISAYLGTNWEMRSNHKLKDVIRLLLENKGNGIRKIGLNPITLQYQGDAHDACDFSFNEPKVVYGENAIKIRNQSESYTPHTSLSFIKCPFQGCTFKNTYQETVDHHFRLTHSQD